MSFLGDVLKKTSTSMFLTLSRVAPSAVSKGGGLIGPPRFLRVLGWLWFQSLVAASDLTVIDTKQKDLQLSDA